MSIDVVTFVLVHSSLMGPWKDSPLSILPVNKLVVGGLRIWVYRYTIFLTRLLKRLIFVYFICQVIKSFVQQYPQKLFLNIVEILMDQFSHATTWWIIMPMQCKSIVLSFFFLNTKCFHVVLRFFM